MTLYSFLTVVLSAAALAACSSGYQSAGQTGEMPPFGQPEDVRYSQALWRSLGSAGMVGKNEVVRAYKGTHPHGAVLDTNEAELNVRGHRGTTIVKKNFGGEGITNAKVTANPNAYLKSVTVMFKRESGYDPETKDWFWVKYKPDGSLHTNPKGMRLAGKVAKGMKQGCIACHKVAPGGDFVYTN